MLDFGICPRCKLEVAEARRTAAPMVCNHCGFDAAGSDEHLMQRIEKRVTVTIIAMAVILLSGFIQVVNWDRYAAAIIPLKAKVLMGVATQADHERIASMCMDLKKYDCVEHEYQLTADQDPSLLNRLGQLQMKRGEYQSAAESFYAFFQHGGQDLNASYSYAKTLAQLDRVDDATKYFDQVLASRPDVIQVTVVENYVKLLMAHQRYDQAKKLIEHIRGEGPTASMFMEDEFQKLKTMTTASRS